MLGLSHQYTKSFDRRRTSSVVNWAVGFEKVLEDPVGLKTFTEFLKREFSAENIKFWIVCEHYRNQTDKHVRRKLASDIVEHHLCSGATEPVNIDSHTRQNAIDGVEEAQQHLFLAAQKQIFNLMKFDSYQRFLKSELFAESLTAEKLGKPLPCQETVVCKSPKKSRSRSKSRDRGRLLHVAKSSFANDVNRSGNKNDSQNNNNSVDENAQKDEVDEKKRKSLLPWQKGRGKSAEPGRSGSRSPVLRERNTNSRRSKRKTGEKPKGHNRDKSDSSTTSNLEVPCSTTKRLPIDELSGQCFLQSEGKDARTDFCRVILPDSSAAVLTTNTEETVGDAIQKLMAKHGLPPMAVEAYVKGLSEAVDLCAPLSNLSSQELVVESRTMVRLELPSNKIIAVKSMSDRTCLETLEPVLTKYGLDIWKVSLQFESSKVPVNLNGPISAANGCRITVQSKEQLKESSVKDSHLVTNNLRRKSKPEMRSVTSLLLDEVIRGRVNFLHDELGILDLENISQDEIARYTDATSSNGDVARRSSFNISKEKPKSLSLYSNRASIHEGMGIKIQLNENSIPQETATTPRRNTAKNVHYRDSCDLTGIWNRAQRRLDDQRGTELNCELPEFLKPRRDSTSRKVSESDL